MSEGMRICWANRFDDGTVTADSEKVGAPVTNLQNAHLAVKWETFATNSGRFTVDLGSSTSVAVLAILGTNLNVSATIRIRADNSDSTAIAGGELDTGVVSAGINENYRSIYRVFNTPISARYWRVDLADTSLSDLRVGRVFMGPAWTPTRAMLYGWSLTYEDASRTSMSFGGQTYVDIRARARLLSFTLSFMDEEEMYDNAFEMARRNGIHTDVLVMPRTTGPRVAQQSVWGLLQRVQQVTHQSLNIFNTRIELLERL